MKLSARRMAAYKNRFLSYFDANQTIPATVLFDQFCAYHGLPQDEREEFMSSLQAQGIF